MNTASEDHAIKEIGRLNKEIHVLRKQVKEKTDMLVLSENRLLHFQKLHKELADRINTNDKT